VPQIQTQTLVVSRITASRHSQAKTTTENNQKLQTSTSLARPQNHQLSKATILTHNHLRRRQKHQHQHMGHRQVSTNSLKQTTITLR
jgi:hypothetical protein